MRAGTVDEERCEGAGMRQLMMALATAVVLATTAMAESTASERGTPCKNGGWVNQVSDTGEAFRNQGQCVAYAEHGGTLFPSTAAACFDFGWRGLVDEQRVGFNDEASCTDAAVAGQPIEDAGL